jgi:hypothetical protein
MEASGCITIDLAIFKKLTWAGVKHPLTNFWGVRSGVNNPLKNFMHLTEIYCPPRPTSKKYCLCISWRLLDHKSHIECTSPSRSKIQYICALPISNYAIDWDFIPEVTPLMKHVINLEIKNITKSSLTLKL